MMQNHTGHVSMDPVFQALRINMQDKICKWFERKYTNRSSEWRQRLPDIAKMLEESIFKESLNKDDYMSKFQSGIESQIINMQNQLNQKRQQQLQQQQQQQQQSQQQQLSQHQGDRSMVSSNDGEEMAALDATGISVPNMVTSTKEGHVSVIEERNYFAENVHRQELGAVSRSEMMNREVQEENNVSDEIDLELKL